MAIFFPLSYRAHAYSLLTHEQLIDLSWQDSIVPLLLSHYPTLTAAQLEQARAYAYGGCVIQDIGYYPFGDKEFSNLTHYVRSGDFVVNLFRDASNADELAFAAGALSHYVGDSFGHAEATNIAVPVEFPELRSRYGPVVNFAEGTRQHVQVEFAFDIDQIAHHRMAPLRFLRRVGLQVPLKQLSLAFYQTYGLAEDFTGRRSRINVKAYRFAVHSFIPRVAYALTLLHRHSEVGDPSTPEALEIEQDAAAVASQNGWQAYRRKAGIGTYALAGLIFVLPKFGPLKMVAIKGPTAATEAEYMRSVFLSMADLRRRLARFTPPLAARQAKAAQPTDDPPGAKSNALPAEAQRHPLPNRDLDTGLVVQPGGYSLTDSTYAHLLHMLALHPSKAIPPGIKEDILAYYANPDAPISTRKNPAQWAQVQADLATLATMRTSTEPKPYPTYGDSDTEP